MNRIRNYNQIPALVLGVDVSALNVIRSLGRRGIKVYAMGCNPYDFGSVSRYAEFVFCENLNDEEKVVSSLLNNARSVGKKMVLICTADLQVLFVSRNREVLREHFDFVLPDHEVIETLMNKKNMNYFAIRHGFPVPQTLFYENRKELHEILRKIRFPCVVKPLYRTMFWSKNIPPEMKVIKADFPLDLRQKLEKLNVLDQQLIFQEWIHGGDDQVYFCLAYIDRERKPLALFTGRKLRQYPSLTGVTSVAESIRHRELAEITLEFFDKSGCKGLCSLEVKYCAIDGYFKITEPTIGRVDLQEGISIQAGLDIPFIAYQDAIKISQPFQSDYRIGLKWINEPFELNAFMTHWRANGYSVRQFFYPYHGPRSFALMARDDPKPFLCFLRSAGKRGVRYLRKIAPLLRVMSVYK